MKLLNTLFENNAAWAAALEQREPGYFARMAEHQSPKYLWIGCSDSRLSATQICGLPPGEMFVHRNVANLVLLTDLNVLSAVQFAVHGLGVQHIIVCGHHGCGGVQAALGDHRHGSVIDGWLYHIKDLYLRNREELDAMNEEQRFERLCELNVVHQVHTLSAATVIQDAWRQGRELSIHGWIYGLADGRLRDLDVCITGAEQLPPVYRLQPTKE